MQQRNTPDVQRWFPSEDGNEAKRNEFLSLIEQLIEGVDNLKNPDQVNLGGEKNREGFFYEKLVAESRIPHEGAPMKEVNEEPVEAVARPSVSHQILFHEHSADGQHPGDIRHAYGVYGQWQ